MRLEDRLRRIADGLPAESTVTFSRDAIIDLLYGHVITSQFGTAESPDLTVGAVSDRFGRSPSTVRGWIREGRLKAYRFGREYRITLAALAAFEDKARMEGAEEVEALRSGTIDLGAWRSIQDPNEG